MNTIICNIKGSINRITDIIFNTNTQDNVWYDVLKWVSVSDTHVSRDNVSFNETLSSDRFNTTSCDEQSRDNDPHGLNWARNSSTLDSNNSQSEILNSVIIM